jgi:hypothetical protein
MGLMRALKSACVGIAAFSLASCYYVPDEFSSTLDIAKDGQFSFTYKGKIRVINASDVKPEELLEDEEDEYCDDVALDKADGSAIEAASAAMEAAANKEKDKGGASKMADDKASDKDDIPAGMHKCTAAELKVKKEAADKTRAAKLEREKVEAEAFMVMMGIDKDDDDAMRELARRIAKQHGYKSVVYEGKGVYAVDYAVKGPLNRDFVFPLFQEQREMLTPFVVVRRQKGNSIAVTAPGYIAGGLKNRFENPALLAGAGSFSDEYQSEAQKALAEKPTGRFTLTTQGQVKGQNSGGKIKVGKGTRTIAWDIKPAAKDTPNAVIKLR